MTGHRRPLGLPALLLLVACAGFGEAPGATDLLRDPAPFVDDRSVHAVIEIPAGTLAKWEVKPSGRLEWDTKDGRPRVVQYLGYPVNYGMIPRTVLPEALGGDGDPVDVLVLGDALPRGSIVPVRPIGVLLFFDAGERDDKILAVRSAGPFSEIRDLAELEARYPGVLHILETWFESYKGPGVLRTEGRAGAEEARRRVHEAAEAFETRAP